MKLTEQGRNFAMCPQYNALFDQYTVEEHLNFVARIKGLSPEDKKHNVDLIVSSMDLGEYLHVRATNLSGGNKRKLSCAMTLLLCPKSNFLDEPTTGVDPVSRRSLFNLIKHLQDSAVVLTTHRMDEAESLCDKIAVMINGKIVCYGTPNYLMQAYGQGYKFTVVFDSRQQSSSAVKQAVIHQVPYSNYDNQKPVEGTYYFKIFFTVADVGPLFNEMPNHLPLSSLFKSLARLKQTSMITEFDVTRATLEQVF